MDEDILKTVESILGKNIKIIDCEKTSSIREEDILLINGIPVQLKGDDGNAIKEALISGQVPSCDLLNQLLFQAGILCKPIELETTLSVKSSMVTKEEITVQRDGNIIDERSSETKEDNIYSSLCQEIWEPLSLSTTTSTTTNTNNTIATSSTSTTCNNNNNNSNNKIKLKSNDKIYNNTNNDYLSTSSSSSSTYNNQLNYDKMLFKNRNHHGIDKMLTTKTVTDIIKKPSSYNQQQQINKYTNIGKTLTESIIYDNNKKIDKISTKSSSSILLGKSSSSSIDNNIKFNEKQKHIINNDNIKSPSLSSSSISSFIPISNNDNSQISISSSSGNCKDFYTNSSISSTSSLSPVQQSNLQLPQQQQQQHQQQQQSPTSQSQSATIKYLKNYNINNKKNNHKYYNNDIDNNINNYNNDNDDDDTASSSIYCDTDDNNDDPDDDIINRISDIYINKNKYNNNNNNNNNSNIINNKLINNDKNLSCDSGHEDDDDNTYNNSKDKYLLQNCNTDNSIKLYLDLNKLNNDDNNIIICNNHHIKQKNIISLSPTQSTITITNKNISSNNDDNDDLLLNTSSSNNKNLMNNFQQQTNNYMKNKKVSSITTDKESLSSSSASSMKIYDKTNEILIPTSTPSSSISINTETDTNLLVYRNGELISGPLDSLIKHMVPTSDYYPDYSYTFAFLLSARLFIRPNELFEKICQLCEEQQNINVKNNISLSSSTSSSSNNQSNIIDTNIIKHDTTTTTTTTIQKLRMFAKNFLKLLSEWINTFPYDFRDERLMQLVRSMTSKCINIDNNLHKDVSDIVQILLQKLTVLEKYENYLKTIQSNDDIINDIKNQYSNNSSSCNNSNNHNNHNNINYNIDTIDSTTTTVTQSQYHYHNNHHNLGGLLGLSLSSSGHTNSSCSIGSNNSSSGGGGGAVGGNCTNSNSGGINIGCSGGINNINNSLTLIEIMEICPTPTVLSQQLTHIELECLSHIGPEEFVQVFAKENSKNIEHQSISDTKKTKNLETYVHWFNRLSYFVATEIVKYSKKKQRVRIVEYWIETAQKCFNIGNFNSLMAIIAGLNMSPILRLKKTWAKVQLAKFSVLEHQMDPSSNFNSYRSTLKAAMWRSAGATDERERIIIPFFSLLVKDLYFLNEGCSSRLSNGHINFEKFWQLSKQIKEFISWKQVTCPFERHQNIIIFLQKNHILNENTLALASFECEPPDNNIEKERFKSLKSELMHSTNNSYNHQS